jgi:hypothetical protein
MGNKKWEIPNAALTPKTKKAKLNSGKMVGKLP